MAGGPFAACVSVSPTGAELQSSRVQAFSDLHVREWPLRGSLHDQHQRRAKPSYELTEEELDKVTVGRRDHEPLISQIVITKDADSQSHRL